MDEPSNQVRYSIFIDPPSKQKGSSWSFHEPSGIQVYDRHSGKVLMYLSDTQASCSAI